MVVLISLTLEACDWGEPANQTQGQVSPGTHLSGNVKEGIFAWAVFVPYMQLFLFLQFWIPILLDEKSQVKMMMNLMWTFKVFILDHNTLPLSVDFQSYVGHWCIEPIASPPIHSWWCYNDGGGSWDRPGKFGFPLHHKER